MESTLRAGAGAPGLKLIETLLWDGTQFPRLDLHLARLSRSAALLGWACDAAAVRRALPAGARPARVRLTLAATGEIMVETAPLPAPKPFWRVSLAPVRLCSKDPWLQVKSTNRAIYDRTRASLPAGIDEQIFQNERGEVCDGTITTVFFDKGQGLRTPPLSAGLLPGVLRAQRAAQEETLLAADLPLVQLWVGNALRGLIPAVFQC